MNVSVLADQVLCCPEKRVIVRNAAEHALGGAAMEATVGAGSRRAGI